MREDNTLSDERIEIPRIKCPVCGAENVPATAMFCKKCGGKLNESPNSTTSLDNANPFLKENNIHSKRVIITTIAIFVIIALVFELIRILLPKYDDSKISNVRQQGKVIETEHKVISKIGDIPTREEDIVLESSSNESDSGEEKHIPIDISGCTSFDQIKEKIGQDMGYAKVVIGNTEALLITSRIIADGAGIDSEVYIMEDNTPK